MQDKALKTRIDTSRRRDRRQDQSAGICVMLLQSFGCPVEPFQHQQSPGQKTNLASQGLSVKDGCLGCRRNWMAFLPPRVSGTSSHLDRLRRPTSLSPEVGADANPPNQASSGKLSRGTCLGGLTQRLQSIAEPAAQTGVIIKVDLTSHAIKWDSMKGG